LRDFAAQRDYVLSLVSPLAPFGVPLLDAVGLTLNESIRSDATWPQGSPAPGEVLVQRGVKIGPRLVGLLAGVGIDKVMTRPKPRVVVVALGASQASLDGAPRLLPDLSSYLVAAELEAQGAQVWRVSTDDPEPASVMGLISDQMIRSDLIVTVGGLESGPVDLTQVLPGLGPCDIADVAITPGHRQGLALVGEDRVPLLALPDEPVAAHVLITTLLVPVLRRMSGADPVLAPPRRARLTQPVALTPGLLTCAHVTVYDNGTLTLRPRANGVAALASINRCNGLALIESQSGQVGIGSWIDYLPLEG
jgi:molybdopterin molybdotransferase